MQTLKKYEKSRGVLVFAFNTATVDYVAIADQTSRLTAQHLQLPITLVTDHAAEPKFAYDEIIRITPTVGNVRNDLNNQPVEWRNFGRYLAYQLSPYDETVLLDTDYLVLDHSILKLWTTEFDYKLMHDNRTAKGMDTSVMGVNSLPFVWATVVLFRRSERAQLFFDLIGRVQRNYHYYKQLYSIHETSYRNDYAFAIANIILNGYSVNASQGIPWSMFTVDQKIEQMTLADWQIRIRYQDTAIIVPRQCIHIMDKEYLQSDDFQQLVEAIIESA
jgi:hypothetical protein